MVDFSGIPTADLRNLRTLLKELNSRLKVIKKRLLRIVFKNEGLDLDPTQFESQVGAIFVQSDIYSVAGKVYKFIKELAKKKRDLKFCLFLI